MMMLCAVCAASAANYLTFTAEEDGSTFGIVNNKNTPDVQYSLDGGETWTALAAGDTITLAHKGEKALLRGDNPEGFSKDYEIYSSFTMTGKIAASGSVMSLIDNTGETLVVPAACFCRLFEGCTSLTKAPALPATELAYACYGGMFQGCSSLTQAPQLPATELTEECYQWMFEGCTSLTQAPELPATRLAAECYSVMFSGCTKLAKAPKLPATQLYRQCYQWMFSRCTNLNEAPELPATQLAKECYMGMFSRCTNLTKAPELPATELKESCYQHMFDSCTSLVKAPELPASTMAYNCYREMFADCHLISEIKVGLTKWSETHGTEEHEYRDNDLWLDNVAPTGTFICSKALPKEFGDCKIPYDWTVKHP